MKKLLVIILGFFLVAGCTKDDKDNIIKPTMNIGSQTWTTKNLDVTTYSDGTPIPLVTDPTAWANLTTGAWCYYNNDATLGATYGKLYNWYAVAGIWNEASKTDASQRKNLAATGFHVPSDTEWATLIDYLGGQEFAGGKMKEIGTTHWESPNLGATNSSGFTALPQLGYRYSGGEFQNNGPVEAAWWSSSELDPLVDGVHLFVVSSYNEICKIVNDNRGFGYYVRCIKD